MNKTKAIEDPLYPVKLYIIRFLKNIFITLKISVQTLINSLNKPYKFHVNLTSSF